MSSNGNPRFPRSRMIREDCCSIPHLACFPSLNIQSPVALRHVLSFPQLGLLRRLRRLGPRGR